MFFKKYKNDSDVWCLIFVGLRIYYFWKVIMQIVVNDKMQQGYVYERTAEEGKDFAEGFVPELSPKQMLKMGIFEGHYLNDCQNEFPSYWFENARLSLQKPDINCNYFKIKSRLPLQQWRMNGWIYGPDVRGWFQWYCRYYSGRRIASIDEIQIKRWRAFKRHLAQVQKNCMPLDGECRKRQRQALLQWAYNPIF